MYWSLYYYLRNYFYYDIKKSPLSTVDFKTYKSENNWWLTDREVRVYVNGVEIPQLYGESTSLTDNQVLENEEDLQHTYKINYIDGEIEFNYTLLDTDVVVADYVYTWLDVKTGWEAEEFSLPALFIHLGTDAEKPLQLGGGEFYSLLFGVDIFGVNESQRNDIAFMLRNALKQNIPIYNYSLAFPLDMYGFINPLFNKQEQLTGYMYVPDIKKIKIEYNPLKSGEDMEKYRANMRFNLETTYI